MRLPWFLSLGFLAICLAAIVLGSPGEVTSEAYDQDRHHLPVIESFAKQLPAPDLREYRSATAPLWHLTLALPARAGVPKVGLRVLAAVAGAALVLLVAFTAVRLGGNERFAWLALPVALSPYTLSGSIWITTDVPATLALMAALAAAAFGRAGAPWLLAIGCAVRQIGVWMALPLSIMAWTTAPAGSGASKRIVAVLKATLPAVLLVGALVVVWGGLTPPGYREQHDRGINLATPAFSLALMAVWTAPLLSWGSAMRVVRARPVVMATAVAIGLLSALLVPSSFNMDAGRWGGPLWTAIKLAPVIEDRSLLLLVAAPIGAMAVVTLLAGAWSTDRRGLALAIGCGILGLVAANSANSQCWERYADLPLLVLLPWLAAVGAAHGSDREQRCLVRGAQVLGLAQAALSIPMVLMPLWRTGFTTG